MPIKIKNKGAKVLSCHEMNNGQILNETKSQYPLYTVILYGDKIDCTKFSKRISCAIKHLPLRVQFFFEYNTEKAINAGVRISPTLIIDNQILIEGLTQAENITEIFEQKFNLNQTQNPLNR